MQVRHKVDGRIIKREAMVPIACLMNHASAAPHVRQYGQLQDGWLHFPASRAITAGEQVHAAKRWIRSSMKHALP